MPEKSIAARRTLTASALVPAGLRNFTARLFDVPLPGRRLPRYIERLNAVDRDYFLRPPIIANSFPHSGAPLLLQISAAFPEMRNFGANISSMPTIPFRERTDIAHDRLIRRIVPGEVVGAQIFFNDHHARRIASRNGVHFFIYRDLRDVAVAEAHALTYVKFWHRLHPFFATLQDDAQRISAAIRGFTHYRFPYNYPCIARRFERFHGWLNRYDVMAIAYEDLHSDRLSEIVRRMAAFYSDRCRSTVDADSLAARVKELVAAESRQLGPEMSPGIWKRKFTTEHIRQFEEVAGALNRRLGYDESRRAAGRSAGSSQDGNIIPMRARKAAPARRNSTGDAANMKRRAR